MVQPAERSLDIPRRDCVVKERGKFPKRYRSVTRMNATNCETPEVFKPSVNGMSLRAEQVSEYLHAPCNATKAAMTFQIRFLLE